MGLFKTIKQNLDSTREQIKKNLEEAQQRTKDQLDTAKQQLTEKLLGENISKARNSQQINSDDGSFSSRLEMLIDSALQDGVLTDQERAVILRRAEKEGEDPEEVEMIINARLAEIQQKQSPAISQTAPPPQQKDVKLSEEVKKETEEIKTRSEQVITGPLVLDRSKCRKDFSGKTSVIVPEGVTKIGDSAFYDCRMEIERVILPSSLLAIDNNAFLHCRNLKSIDLSRCINLKRLGDGVFDECEQLKDIDLSHCEKLESFDCFEFSSIESCILPPSLKVITKDDHSFLNRFKSLDFSNCKQLEKIEVDFYTSKITAIDLSACKKLVYIGESCFQGTNLESVILPASLKSLEDSTFCGCTNLKTVDLSQCAQLKSIGERAFASCTNLKTVDLSQCAQLESIGESAFESCTNLDTVDISQCAHLESIGEKSFASTGITSIVIPDKVEHIGKRAFAYNKQLMSAIIGSSAKDYGDYDEHRSEGIFLDCPNLVDLTFKSRVAEFTRAKALKRVTFCNTVNEVGKWAVSDCPGLEEVVIADSVTRIGYAAFARCENLSSIVLPDSISEIDDGTFHETKLAEIVFPRELRKIGFLGTLSRLRKLDFSKVTKLSVIPEDFIDEAPKLKTLTIPIGVITIEENIGGENLHQLFLPPTIKEVQDINQVDLDIYCFSPSIEELGLMVDEIEDEQKANRLHVLPEYLESYKAQRDAEGISSKILIIDEIPEELRYYYDN